ncbi:hypothetical protein VULLAG_LOCUS10145 [Vulpes lagopus]
MKCDLSPSAGPEEFPTIPQAWSKCPQRPGLSSLLLLQEADGLASPGPDTQPEQPGPSPARPSSRLRSHCRREAPRDHSCTPVSRNSRGSGSGPSAPAQDLSLARLPPQHGIPSPSSR